MATRRNEAFNGTNNTGKTSDERPAAYIAKVSRNYGALLYPHGTLKGTRKTALLYPHSTRIGTLQGWGSTAPGHV